LNRDRDRSYDNLYCRASSIKNPPFYTTLRRLGQKNLYDNSFLHSFSDSKYQKSQYLTKMKLANKNISNLNLEFSNLIDVVNEKKLKTLPNLRSALCITPIKYNTNKASNKYMSITNYRHSNQSI
jgi:hypothetical protein